ncbi:MBL fold metallo-hydrolase [Marinimicrococcus flavescens]|uniref:MBL fold metallo-hydrolase n=1 Tax=Marinimicrococcus flavescens TaxID=3031815 RepID=A0AAP4D7I0_9PROT|nr:MBL fold metallo-hydrolase [Marinimicrococcus flavescens]
MTIRFEQILTEGTAQLSYLVGDDAAGVAAVIDPRPDCEIYLETARRHGLAITHILETHIHADFLSGARELADRVGGDVKLCLSVEGGARYGFAHEPLRDGHRLELGGLVLTARFTPGHTPEHLAFLLADKDRAASPFAVLTGDSLFADSVGRPDLLGDEQTEALTRQLFATMRDFYLKLDDGVLIYPCHGAGSACGPDIGEKIATTIGFERRHNPYLQCADLESFKKATLGGSPPVPTHYPRLKKVNAEGPPVMRPGPRCPALPVAAFDAALRGDVQLLDTRDMLAFGGGHIEGALNIAARPELSVWSGWLLDPQEPILLVLEDDRRVEEVVALLWRTGFTHFAGYLAGGMAAWQEAGRPLRRLRQSTVHEVSRQLDEIQVVDVRAPDEWQGGHVPGAVHRFVPDLARSMDGLDRGRPVATYCASGFRASIAASLLARAGFADVRNIPGSWKAWRAAGLPVEKP